MKKSIISIGLLLCVGLAYAQSSGNRLYFSDSVLINTSKVYANGKEKKLAWCGGVNTPNFALADLNNDSKPDLVIYEEYTGTNSFFINGVRTFINRGTAGVPNYVYEPRYEFNFPAVKDLIKMFDYNCDNIPDMLTWAGLRLYKGKYNANNELCFDFVKEIMYYEPWLGYETYINITAPEIPSVEDVDNDGDPDIVALGLSGNISWYRNMRTELSLPCDSVLYRIKDRCWGKVLQQVQREHILHHTCDNSGLKTTHGANSLTLFDHDGDGDFDVLDGNFSYSDLQYLHNGRLETGYHLDSMISQDTTWQTNGHKLVMPQFPASFWLDVTQDGLRDILVSPHGVDAGENYKCIAYYKNTGTPGNYQYTYQSDTFLVDQMIDLGTAAYPALYDYNKDGKPDLFVGSSGYYRSGHLRSNITYYKNTSTPGNISFELVTNNFMLLTNFEGAAPAMGDIDNDGKDDLIIGRTDGTMVYYKNAAPTASDQPVWQLAQPVMKDASGTDINVGYYAAPFVYDIDKDGKNDLIVGSQHGSLQYYKNVTTSNGTIMLQKVTESLGNARSDPNVFTNGFSTPFIGKLDDSGIDYILMGSSSGALYQWDGFQAGNTTSPYLLKDTLYSQIRIGQRTAPAVANIDGDPDNKMEMIVGNILGGLNIYQQRFTVGVSELAAEKYKLDLYPNPVKSHLFMHLNTAKDNGDAKVLVYNSIGQVVSMQSVSVRNKTIDLDVSSFPAGVYLCQVKFDQATYTGKFTKE